MRGVVPLLALFACGGSQTNEVKPIAIRPINAMLPAPKPDCVRQPEEAAPINHATGDGSRVSYCVGTAVDQCFTLELETGKLKRLSAPPTAQDRSVTTSSYLETTNPELKVCNDAGCKTLTPQVWPGAAPLRAATNGSFAAVLLGNAEAGKGYVDVYDVTKPKKLTTFKYAHGEYKCGDVAMLGDTIFVSASACTSPSARGALYTARGRKIASVGGKGTFGTYGAAFTQVDGSVWAFLDENGNLVVLQDVASGKVKKSIDVGALFERVRMGNPGESAIVRLGAGKLAVIAGSPSNGSVAIVDSSNGAVKIVQAPLCAAGS